MTTNAFGVEHDSPISKRHYALRPAAENTQGENAKAGAMGAGSVGAATGAAIGAAGMKARRASTHKYVETAARSPKAGKTKAAGWGDLALDGKVGRHSPVNVRRIPTFPKTRGAAVGAAVGGAAFGAYGAGVGALLEHKPKKKGKKVSKAFFEDVSKLGEWKTIEQRERAQRGNRKVKNNAIALGAGGALAVGGTTELMRPGATEKLIRGARGIARQDKNLRSLNHAAKGAIVDFPKHDRAKYALRSAKALPGPAKVVGGAALAGGAALGVAGGARGMEAYHQKKINQRRRANKARGVSKAFSEPVEKFNPVRAANLSVGVGRMMGAKALTGTSSMGQKARAGGLALKRQARGAVANTPTPFKPPSPLKVGAQAKAGGAAASAGKFVQQNPGKALGLAGGTIGVGGTAGVVGAKRK